MKRPIFKTLSILAGILCVAAFNMAYAGDVQIIAAEMQQRQGERWSINVTLKHQDTGWEHYADNWRIVNADGKILGDRVLYHPHVNEQPFTRGLSAIEIPKEESTLYIEAHDKMHGWSPQRLKIDLTKMSTITNGRLVVRAP